MATQTHRPPTTPAAPLPGWRLLDAAARITRHKDRALVDAELVGVVAALWHAPEVRLYQVAPGEPARCRELVGLCQGRLIRATGEEPQHPVFIPDDTRGDAYSDRGGLSIAVRDVHRAPMRLLHMTATASLTHGDPSLRALVDLYRNHLNLIDDAEHDTLTGLRNRRTFDHTLVALVANEEPLRCPGRGFRRTAARAGGRNWLAVLDVDHFKSINDRFGHLFGDEVLILLANLMRQSFRSTDTAFRFGGEEFVVVLRDSDQAGAEAAVERFRQRLEAEAFPQIGRITISAGYTEIAPGDLPSDVLNQADAALYYAKDNGRNRCCCYEHLVASGALERLARAHGAGVELF